MSRALFILILLSDYNVLDVNCARSTLPHAYNDPDLSPIEFLYAVMRAQHQPTAIRIEAAKALFPFTEPRPASIPSLHIGCTIVIGGLGPCPSHSLPDHGSVAEDPEQINTISQSFSRSGSNNPQPSSEATAPVYTETTSYPPSLPDYSIPPTHTELQEIKAAINRLRPDLAHLPVPEPHLCACGHWIFGPCPLGERCCDRTKLN